MSDSYQQLPSDTSNTGKKIRAQTRTVGSDTVYEAYSHPIADYRAYSDQTLICKQVRFNAATSGDHDVITAVAAHKLRVHGLTISVNAANTVTFKDDTPTTLLALYFAANGGMSDNRPSGWFFETGSGKKLVANFSVASDVEINVLYTEVA